MSATLLAYAGFIGLTSVERIVEVRVSLRNAAWSLARGGREFGRNHYPFMVALHTGFLVACIAEAWLLQRPFLPAVGGPLIVAAAVLQGLRWWCITALGPRWNTRVIIVPGLPRVTAGPYRWMSHPNYVVVALEGVVLPLIHSAWITALAFTLLNAVLLWVRICVENQALAAMDGGVAPEPP
ncbi:MAG: isoprenylcysteine carboxyl methyltransferase family protein [Myxococcota bacterium]|nr:isoprenylcysteine carboxyl methyltransferase family protein [Myxococcota bacterium]